MYARSAEESPPRVTCFAKLLALLGRLFSLAAASHRKRRLRVCETLSLGEKRFIAVVEYDRQKFLLAGTPQNISLLQRLDEGPGNADPQAPSPASRAGLLKEQETI
jgi:flagellar biogenesis protein FliO